MQIKPLTPHLGAEVLDVDLANLSDHHLDALRSAFVAHKVLVVRDQTLDREAHKRFARYFGELHVHPSKRHLGAKGDPEIFTVKTTPNTRFANGEVWHSDVSCEAIPPLGSALYVRELPGDSGGDTLFANMTLAFASLSDPIKALLRPLRAVHDGRKDLERYEIELQPGQTYPRAEHPVVPIHPQSGEEILFVNPSFTDHLVGLPPAESAALLDMLYRHVTANPRLHCRVRWQPGSLTLWDNRSTWHHAVWDYFPNTRHAERVSILGTAAPSR